MMGKLNFVFLFFVLLGAVQCLRQPPATEPLYLTPYIERGENAIAKSLSRVNNQDLFLKGITSYAGFFTVNKNYNSNLFAWYFPAAKNSHKAPVVLWLQGGPGASSLYGLFMENGPVYINSTTLKLQSRDYSWNKEHNVLYIDNPVGAGFSFTDNPNGYLTNQVDIGNNLLDAVSQFFQLFPELKKNGLYVTGESYAGKYIPALCYAIYENRESSDLKKRINLKGLAIGNGVTDPVNQLLFGDLLYQLGFIDNNSLQIFNERQAVAVQLIQLGNYTQAAQYAFSLINMPDALFNNLTGFTSPYNFLKQNGYDEGIDAVNSYMLKSGIEKYLHVGNRTFTSFADVNTVLLHLQNDILQSVAPWVAVLINNYKVIIYNGMLDILAGPTLTQNYLSKLKFNSADEYRVAQRNFWTVNNQLAGYYKKAGNLTELTIRLAGHMVPVDQPEWAYDLLTRLTGEGF